jgi:HPt (histidine-containing phosphotransfer) domain-containing protein
MANEKRDIEVKAFADHHVITQPNPLRKVLRRVEEKDLDDPVERAEKALAGLSGEFKNWMTVEADRLSAAHAAVLKSGFTDKNCEELFRAAHDIKGDAATFGYPSAGAAAESLCRIIEHAPELAEVPSNLIAHHINAIQAIVRERTKLDVEPAIARRRRRVSHAGQSRPARASRSHPCPEPRARGLRRLRFLSIIVVPAKALLDAHIFWSDSGFDQNRESFQRSLNERHQSRSKSAVV